MDFGIRGKAAIVAAASRGLGREVAWRLGEEGARVAICARGEERLRKTAAEIRDATGAEVFAQVADVSDGEQAGRFARDAMEHFGGVHILVTNAGGPPAGQFLEHEPARWRETFELTLMSVVHLCRAVAPRMIEQRWGRIVNMTSVAVKQPAPNLVLSNAVRSAVVGLGKSMANELGRYNVLVNNVCPGFFLTDRAIELARKYTEQAGVAAGDYYQQRVAAIPIGRMGDPSEFGSLVAFLCSERASYITGATFAIDGGMSQGLL